MKIVFCTYVEEKYYHSMGCDRLVKSMKHFHPEIPIIVYSDAWIKRRKYKFGQLHPSAILSAMEEYEAVIYVDADSLIVGRLDEAIKALKTMDVVVVRNNNDYHKAGKDEPIAQPPLSGTEHYVNAGFVATKSMEFARAWGNETWRYAEMLPFMEQSTLNAVVQNFNHYMIDGDGAEVYYGVSALFGEETHWDSWKDIEVDGTGALKLNGKTIKVLHHGGGFSPYKMGFHMFNDQTVKRLIEIVGL